MTSSEIRQQFIDFFKEKGHTFVPSSLVVPYDDPTLLFTNAGMNQFKDVFLGTGKREYTRAANTQKCIRAGGKHNDLDDVGHDTYHHTFFEMLGNWSFGDYFKAEAIEWAWELLVDRWGLEPDRLHATYFEGNAAEGLEPDDEARELWLKILPPERVHPGKKKDNFWEMGETGPCGPCSEIHVDLTPDKSGASLVNAGDPRVMELWNLVFIQFNRDAAGKLTPLPAKHVDTGLGFERVTALLQGKNSNYDTDIFTPIFDAIQKVTGVEKYTGLLESDVAAGVSPAGAHDAVMRDVAYRVIADHLRCLVFAITDGGMLSNEGRGYVLRRILRRAVRYGRQYFNAHEPFLHKLVPIVIDTMSHAFPELSGQGAAGFSPRDPSQSNSQKVAEVIRDEEESFGKTVDRGIRLFNNAAATALMNTFKAKSALSDRRDGEYKLLLSQTRTLSSEPVTLWERGGHRQIESRDRFLLVRSEDIQNPVKEFAIEHLSPQLLLELKMPPPVLRGEDAFMLHDTYGFPIDLTEVMAGERGLQVETAEYERMMEEARERSRCDKATAELAAFVRGGAPPTEDRHKWKSEMIVESEYLGWIDSEGQQHASPLTMATGRVGVVLSETAFYSEQGGQVGDGGLIQTNSGIFEVEDTQRRPIQDGHGEVVVHLGRVRTGRLIVNQGAAATVDSARSSTMKNHTSTHIMNWVLRDVLGNHVEQKGSLVDPEKTRFDFSHRKAVSAEELAVIEEKSNEQINKNLEVFTDEVPKDKALQIKTLRAVFGETYPEKVRVVSIGKSYDDLIADPDNAEWMNYSVEFCGGTHLKYTGEAERFRIIEETSVAKGIRRITAVTGERAKKCDENARALLDECEKVARLPEAELAERVADFGRRVNDEDLPYLARLTLREKLAELQSRVKKYAKKQAGSSAKDVRAVAEGLLEEAESVGASKVIVGQMPSAGPEQIREAIDYLRTEAGSAGICLGCVNGEKVLLFAAFTNDLVGKGLKAGDLIKAVAPAVGGGGGGKPELAQAGGKNPAGLPKALDMARDWLTTRLQP